MVDADPMATASDISIEDYTLRLDGICSQTFRDSKILVVGVGAGSYMVEKLARLCPSLLILVDPDIVEASNLARTSFSMDDIGYSKVESLANRIREINPFVEVKIYQSRIEDLAVDVLEEVFSSDLVIAGTDSFEAQAFINEQAVKKSIPALWIGIHARGFGGRLIWRVGENPCYRCIAKERYELFEDETIDNSTLNLEGMVGSLADCQIIDMFALKIIVAIIERDADSDFGRFFQAIQHCNELIIRTHPDYPYGNQLQAALLSDLPSVPIDYAGELSKYLITLDSIWLSNSFKNDCPLCSPKGTIGIDNHHDQGLER